MAVCASCGQEDAGTLFTCETRDGGFLWSERLCGQPACLASSTARLNVSFFRHCGYDIPGGKPDVLLDSALQGQRENA